MTLGKHPVALLRSILKRRRALTARELHQLPQAAARACGLITMPQRPMTASDTVFLTLEDETGCVNAVLETDGEVHHLIADRVHVFSEPAARLRSNLSNLI